MTVLCPPRAAAFLLLWGSVAACAGLHAPDSAARPPPADVAHCVDADALDLRRLLPPPPATGSPQARAELDELLRLQSQRTPAQVELARQDVEVNVARFADALGSPPALTLASLPLTTALFKDVTEADTAVVGPAKDAFARPRPFVVERRLEPVVARPASGAYPSGHATWAYTVGLVLADMIPERRAAILARASEYAHNRNVAGVHYPSDVQAGELAATAVAATLFGCGPFQRQEAAAARELRGALGLPQQRPDSATR